MANSKEYCSCREKGRDVAVAVSLCKLQRKESQGIHLEVQFQHLFSHQTETSRIQDIQSRGGLLCFSCHLKRVLSFAQMSSQLNVSVRTEYSSRLKVGLCFCKVVVSFGLHPK